MTIVESEETPLELESAEGEPPADKPLGAFTRPQGGNGWKDWLFTVDHKKIGIMYGAAGLLFFVIGGIYALFMRLQLSRPGNSILSAETYNQVFTMRKLFNSPADWRKRRRLPKIKCVQLLGFPRRRDFSSILYVHRWLVGELT